MDSVQVLNALERERRLLENFLCLSEEQLLLLEDNDIPAVNALLERRSDLMMELTAIEATLGTWISQIQTDPSLTPEMMREFRAVNDEIVSMANHIVDIDEQTHNRLDEIKQRTRIRPRFWNQPQSAWHGFAASET